MNSMRSATKPLVSIILLCIAFGVSYVASAQTPEATSTESLSSTSAPVVLSDDARRGALESAASSIRNSNRAQSAALTETAQSRIINLAANLSNKMDAAAYRMDAIANRLESRIEKERALNIDVAAAEAALADTRSSLSIATSLLTDIDTAVVNATTAVEPARAIGELRATYEAIGTALRQTHSGLRTTHAALTAAPTFTSEETSTSTPAETE